MAELKATKYPNNIRIVSGNVFVFPDDVVLLCDTSSGPVTINLLGIPLSYWSTQYKLYIVDNSNNAGVNNITINAGSGIDINGLPVAQTVNGTSNAVINTNKGACVIRIIGNYNYTANNNSFGCCPGAGIVPITNVALNTLITAGTVSPETYYQVTDPLNAVSVIVQGFINNLNTTVQGSGYFLNADYQKVGNYSAVTGFTANIGIWQSTPLPVVAGDVVIWFNKHYKNLTGVWGTSPDTDAVNWQLLFPSLTNGYIGELDFIKYNVSTNRVIYRSDKRNNEVEDYTGPKGNTIDLFQWGRDVVTYNKVLTRGLLYAPNSNASFISNEITTLGILEDYTNSVTPGSYQNNQINLNCIVRIENNKGSLVNNKISNRVSLLDVMFIDDKSTIANCIIETGSKVILNTLNITEISFVKLSQQSEIILGTLNQCLLSILSLNNRGILTHSGLNTWTNVQIISSQIEDVNVVKIPDTPDIYNGKKISSGYSNWNYELDFTNPAIYDVLTQKLTIPGDFTYVGNFIAKGCIGLIVVKIENSPFNHKFTIRPRNGENLGMQHTLVGAAVLFNMVCDAPGSLNTLIGRTNGSDVIEYYQNGDLIVRSNLVLLA